MFSDHLAGFKGQEGMKRKREGVGEGMKLEERRGGRAEEEKGKEGAIACWMLLGA